MSDDKVFAYALKALARREHSELQLRARIRNRFSEVAEDTVDTVIADLVRRRYLDDGRFAESLVRSRPDHSREWFEAALAEAGVEAGRIRTVLDARDWPSLGSVLRAKMKSLRLATPLQPKDAVRLSRALMRLGYDAEEVRIELENLV